MILTMSQDGVVKFWKRTSVSTQPVVDLPTSSSATKPQPMDATGKCMEFIKSYTAHTAPPQAMVMSLPDGDTAASVGEDNVIKFYDIGGFDVTGMIKVGKDYKCGRCAAYIGEDQTLVAVSSGSVKSKDQKPTSSASSSLRVGDIFIFSSLTLSPIPIRTITHHTVPVTAMSYNYKHQCMISCDSKGVLEYWNGAILNNSSDKIIYGEASSSAITSVVNDYEAIEDVGRNHAETIQQREVNESTFGSIGALPTNAINGISFASKLNDTDLCSLLKKKTYAISLTMSPTGNHFAVYGSDRKVRLFDYATGKILVNYDERMKVYDALVKKHASRQTSNGMDAIDYGKRAATEREMTETSVFTAPVSAVDNLSLVEESGNQSIAMEFDPTGRYILLPTIIGIKVIEWKTNKCKQIIGKGDASTLRLLGGCICLGNARVDRQMLLARGGMENNAQAKDEKEEPISDSLCVTMAYKKRRIYVFSHSDPVTEAEEKGGSEQEEVYFSRDILNEPPDPEELILNSQGQAKEENKLGKEAILRTTMGDIHIKLFPNDTPRTIENFCGHARSGYYDNVIFHRVIKGFMIQTGDPLGDGTGGERFVVISFGCSYLASLLSSPTNFTLYIMCLQYMGRGV